MAYGSSLTRTNLQDIKKTPRAFQDGVIISWSTSARTKTITIGSINYPIRRIVYSLRSETGTYEFQSKKKRYEMGDEVRFRIGREGKILVILGKRGKEKKFKIVGVTQNAAQSAISTEEQ